MVGEAVPCYAVSVIQSGNQVQGFVLGDTLPAIQEFERRRALESRVPVEVPLPSASAKAESEAKPHPTGPPFEPWSGSAINGRRVQIAPGSAKATLVTFWSVESAAARRYAETLSKTGASLIGKGVRSIGFLETPSLVRAKYYLDDMSLDYPQAIDSAHLAAKYGANAGRGTTLVLDESNHIIATSSDPAVIRAAVMSLLSSK